MPRRLLQLGEARQKRLHDRSTPSGCRLAHEWHHPNPWVLIGQPVRDGARAVGRAVIDDHPCGRERGLFDHRRGEAGEVVGLVSRRRDDGIGEPNVGHAGMSVSARDASC